MKNIESPISGVKSLRFRMTLLFIVACAAVGAITCANLLMVKESNVSGAAYATIDACGKILEANAQTSGYLYRIVGDVHSLSATADSGDLIKTAASLKTLLGAIDQRITLTAAQAEQANARIFHEKSQAAWRSLRSDLSSLVIPALDAGNLAVARTSLAGLQTSKIAPFALALESQAHELHGTIGATEKRVATELRVHTTISILVACIALGLLALIAYTVTTSISRPLRILRHYADSVGSGKLNERLTLSGPKEVTELAQALNTMTNYLQEKLLHIRTVSETLAALENNIEKNSRTVTNSTRTLDEAVTQSLPVIERIGESVVIVAKNVEAQFSSASETSSSTLEFSATIEEIAMNADSLGTSFDEVGSAVMEMAASIREICSSIVNLQGASVETASAISQMDTTIKQVEKNALDASTISKEVLANALTGKRAVEEAISGMHAIRDASLITAEVIENLSRRATDIGVILSVIDEVAEQTNLLALNATIIAAQAGEQGKGFAVVADEIRELSERTSSSTREIADVIKGVQEETVRAVAAISRAEVSISEGEQRSQHSGAALEKIVSGVQQASLQVDRIARVTLEQTCGSLDIKESIESIALMVEQIANAVVEHVLSSEAIARSVEHMKDLVVHVRASTYQQSQTSNIIAQATREALENIEKVRKTGSNEYLNSARVAAALNAVQTSTSGCVEGVKVLDVSLSGLARQVRSLESNLAELKL